MIYEVEIKIEAKNEIQLSEKLEAFNTINKSFQHHDLLTLTKTLVEFPQVGKIVNKYSEAGIDWSEMNNLQKIKLITEISKELKQ
ncbi:MAG: hypothetical protein JXR68_14200 [Bacteroidales bacterium]|nr:hypothetical protein [Bacteroidales bacterium]